MISFEGHPLEDLIISSPQVHIHNNSKTVSTYYLRHLYKYIHRAADEIILTDL